ALAAGLHHESAGGGIHEPPAGGLRPAWRGRGDCGCHGNAGRSGADLRSRHVLAARAEHARAGGRVSRALPGEARRHGARAGCDHRLRTDGRRRAGRRVRRRMPADPELLRGLDQDAVLRQRCSLADSFRVAVRGVVSIRLVWFAAKGGTVSGRFEELVGNAILGIDTLWGGDVMCASGTGRFIADSWFSDEPLPSAYTDPRAARVRKSGGVLATTPDRDAMAAYLDAVDIPGAIHGLKEAAVTRGEYIGNLALCFETMWDLAMEMIGK